MKNKSFFYYGIYALGGIMLLIGVLATGTYGLSKNNIKVYETAAGLRIKMEQMGFPGFQLEDYPVRFYDGNHDYVIFGGQADRKQNIKKENSVFQTYVGTTTEVDGSWQVVVPVLEQFSELMDMMAGAGAMAEGGLAADCEIDSYGIEEHAATLWHEAFHAYQITYFEEEILGLVKEELPEDMPMESVITSEIDEDVSRKAAFERELELLKTIYHTDDAAEKRELTTQYLKSEKSRKEELSDTARWVEQYYETVEGTACFVESYAYQKQMGTDVFEKQYIEDIAYTVGCNKYYSIGMLKCCILDQLSSGWESTYDFSVPLDELLEHACDEI